MMPEVLKKVKAGFYGGENYNNFCREIDRRINHPEAPVIMELKKPGLKKPEPLPEGAKKVSVYMFKGCSAETTDKKVVITEIAPHVYTYVYKLKRYGERIKIIFEIDGVYFQGHDTGTYVLEREDFTEVCTKAYKLARQNVADGAASGMAYFIEVQKRIDAATPAETPRISTEAAETVNVSVEEKKAVVAAKKPIWKQANELAGEYEKRGYQFVYNDRTKLCYLTIPGHIFVDGSQCTTELTYVMTGKIDDFRDVPKAVGEYNAMYCAKYAERCPQMLAYLPTEPRETVNVSAEGEKAANGINGITINQH